MRRHSWCVVAGYFIHPFKEAPLVCQSKTAPRMLHVWLFGQTCSQMPVVPPFFARLTLVPAAEVRHLAHRLVRAVPP